MIYRAAAVLWVAGFMAVVWCRSEAVPSGSGLGRAEAVSPPAVESIEALLSEAGDLGYDVAPLRNKLLEGRAKGKSDEAILKALRLRMYKMESSAQLSPSRKGFDRALFLLEAAPKNTEGKPALDGKPAGTEKQVSLPPATKSKPAQVKREPVWTPARATAEPPEVPRSANRPGLSNGGKPGDLGGSGTYGEHDRIGGSGQGSAPPGRGLEKAREIVQEKVSRVERHGESASGVENKLENRQEKLETRLERKQKKLEDKEKVLEKKVKALERALEKSEKRRGRPF